MNLTSMSSSSLESMWTGSVFVALGNIIKTCQQIRLRMIPFHICIEMYNGLGMNGTPPLKALLWLSVASKTYEIILSSKKVSS